MPGSQTPKITMNKLLTPDEMAEYIGVKKSTIYQWTHIGYIPHIKMGKFVRFKLSQIDKWLESHSTDGRKTRKVSILSF